MNDDNAKPAKRIEKPSRSSGPAIPIVRLKGGEKVQFTCFSEQTWGFVIHWNRKIKRSQPCHGSRETCEGCKDELPEKEVFYLEGFSPKDGHCFFELTPEAKNKFDHLFGHGEGARGQTILLQRTASSQGRLLLTWESAIDKKAKLPQESDPEPFLQILWAWGRR